MLGIKSILPDFWISTLKRNNVLNDMIVKQLFLVYVLIIATTNSSFLRVQNTCGQNELTKQLKVRKFICHNIVNNKLTIYLLGWVGLS